MRTSRSRKRFATFQPGVSDQMRKPVLPFLLLCLLQFCDANQIQAQTPSQAPAQAITQTESPSIDLDKDRLPIVPLPALWRFHAGDDPAWAGPTFDDSGWSLLRSDSSWNKQGYSGYRGIGWYRFQLVLSGKIKDVSFTLPPISTSFEVFADGVPVGSYGKMPPHPVVYRGGYDSLIFAVPSHTFPGPNSSRKVTIAIRVWNSLRAESFGKGGPMDAGGNAGESGQIESLRELNLARDYTQQASQQVLGLLEAFAALGALLLFLLRRKELEYLWFSLRMSGAAVFLFILASTDWHSWNDRAFQIIYSTWTGANTLLYIAFFLQLLKPRRDWLLKLAVVCTLLEILNDLVEILFPTVSSPWFSNPLDTLLDLPSIAWILVVLLIAARKKSQSDSRWVDARLLLIPFLLKTTENLMDGANYIGQYLLKLPDPLINYDLPVISQPFQVSISDIVEVLSMLCFLGILVVRFTRTRGEQERYAAEVEGAREVQQFLIPEDLPHIPGLAIQSDYRPAREVGGDFFQIIPDPADGSALILVGDVAGKGMQAGMLATLLVGAMRTAASFSRDPSVILSTLNNRLHGNGNATCLALRIESTGAATLVNAGHLPPYVNGVELPMEGALPLGTIPNNDFPVLHFLINPWDTVTLISDGILEAQKPDGELFGFDRISELLLKTTSAATLADAAQAFGQEDDITVLTIARAPAVA